MELLDNRLQTIFDMVPSCGTVVDVGCDHGLLITSLLLKKKCQYGIATDVNRDPLSKAERLLASYGLKGDSTCLLTDGLTGIEPVGTDVVIIAGMGGELIRDIISRWNYRENPTVTYFLQPMTKSETLRRWLFENNFSLQQEKCCEAKGKLYSVMQVQYTGISTPTTAEMLYFGAIDRTRDEWGKVYCQVVLDRLEKKITGLIDSKPSRQRDEDLSLATKILLALRETMEGDTQ